jgi:N-acetylglucosaminyl-diphospho-decaprenol L-rhamnosyltransferase
MTFLLQRVRLDVYGINNIGQNKYFFNMELSFVIIEYYSIEDITQLIESLKRNFEEYKYEIIISSNSLYKADVQNNLIRQFPQVIWSFNKKNGGFAYGMNQGLKRASGKYLIISNPDIVIGDGLDSLLFFMNNNPFIGVCAPQIMDNEGTIQDSCRRYVSLPQFIIRQLRRILFHKGFILNHCYDYNKIQTVDWVCGAFMVISRSAYDATNGFDCSYFMYAEDLDFCTRVRKKGYEIVYYPKMHIIYEGSRSARKSKKYAAIFLKSHLLYWKKFGFIYGYPKREKKNFES